MQIEEIPRAVYDTSNVVVLKADSEELEAHQAFLELLNKKSKGNCIWTHPTEENAPPIH